MFLLIILPFKIFLSGFGGHKLFFLNKFFLIFPKYIKKKAVKKNGEHHGEGKG